MDILIKPTRIFFQKNKYKRGELFRKAEKKVKTSSPRMGFLDIQAQLKSFMYVERSLRGDPRKYKLIDEINFKKCIQLKRIQKSKFFVGITVKQRTFIIHPEFMVDNQKLKISLFRISKVTQTRFMT